jgi:hypothetical protein
MSKSFQRNSVLLAQVSPDKKKSTNSTDEKIRIPRKDHIDYNNFVKDKQNPREAMQKLYEMCKQVLTPGVREVMETVLYKTDDDLFYIPELLK